MVFTHTKSKSVKLRGCVGGCTFNDNLHGCLHTGEIEQKKSWTVFQENEKLNEIFEEFYRSCTQVLLLVVIYL